MRPLFSVHAGEFLVGNEIERRFPAAGLWMPAKDTGVDFLVTNAARCRMVGVQVKYSRDFSDLHPGMSACSWFRLDPTRLEASSAHIWIFVLLSPVVKRGEQKYRYILISPRELAKRLRKLHGGTRQLMHTYFWVAENNGSSSCWEARGLGRAETALMAKGLAKGLYRNLDRDFTTYLDAWNVLGNLLGLRTRESR
jgi:hypothetical protein